MNINATLLGEMLTFLVLVSVTMKYIWPPIIKALDERQAQIAKGLASAEQGERALEEAEKERLVIIEKAKQEAKRIIHETHQQMANFSETSREEAKKQAKQLIVSAQIVIEQEKQQAKEALARDMGKVILEWVQTLLEQEMDESKQQQWIEQLAKQDLLSQLNQVSGKEVH